MNILITFLSAHRNVFGGMERSIYSLIKGLEYNKCTVYVYTGLADKREGNFIYSSYLKNTFNEDVSLIDYNILENYRINSEKLRAEIFAIINAKKIDYILVVDQLWGILPHINIMKDIKCRVGIVYHMYLQETLISKTLQLPFSNYFVVSNDVKKKIEQINIWGKKIDLLPNSYNEEEFFCIPNITKKKRIFCNTRLAENKGVEYLLEAFEKFYQDYNMFELILCGGEFHFGNRSKTLSFINSFLKNHPQLVNNIKILGNLEWAKIPSLIQESEIVVLPSGYESFGIAALETIACETTLIATNVGNLPELIKNAGILVPYANSERLYWALKEVVENKKLVNELNYNCKKVRKPYEAKVVAKNFLLKLGESAL